MRTRQFLFSICVALFVYCSPALAVETTIVFIECTLPDGKVSRGSGVLISNDGKVLTAAHVVKDGVSCRGTIGYAAPDSGIRLNFLPETVQVDARVLQFADQTHAYEFVKFCKIEAWMIRSKIFVAGFPNKTRTGAPSFREGVLATTLLNSEGMIETDGQTVVGMSGGPVFSNNLKGLIGIVAGAEFDAGGLVSNYAILPISKNLEQTFGIVPTSEDCYHRSRNVDLKVDLSNWKPGLPDVSLGVNADDGVCFLAGVSGLFNSDNDRISVDLHADDNTYYLSGANDSGGHHSAAVRCVWLD